MAASPQQPVFDEARCVHDRVTDASCSACADACPTGALSLGEEALEFNVDACNGCMLCIAACPEEAIAPESGRIDTLGLRKGENAYLPCDGQYCGHVLSWRDALRLYTNGVRELVLPAGQCRKSDVGNERFEKTIGHVNALLTSRRLPGLRVCYLDTDQWASDTRRLSAASEVSPRRRAFLKRIADPGHEKRKTDLPPTVAALLGESAITDSIFPSVPSINTGLCDGCDACTRVCNSGALTLLKNDGFVYRVDASHCTGCNLCRDVCHTDAVSVRRWTRSSQQRVELTSCRCPACGVDYHSPKPRDDKLCTICSTTNHHRKLFQTDPV